MPLVALLGQIALCLFFSYQIMRTLANLHAGSHFLYRLFLFPGIILHETAHAAACLITLTPIHHISFWDEQGGHVIHTKPRFHLITQPLISFAPLPVGLISLSFLGHYLTGHSRWGIIAGILMISIAATLAPSKADVGPSIVSLIMFSLILGGIYYFAPATFNHVLPSIERLSTHLHLVTITLGIIWLGLTATWQAKQAVR